MEMEGALSGQQDLAGLFGEHHTLVNRLDTSKPAWLVPRSHFLCWGQGGGCARGQDEPWGAPGGKLPNIKIIPSAQLEVLLGVKCG